jgi:putative ABC transport system permease protein
MKYALIKDALREIRRNPGRFLSIFMIVAIGTAFFAGVKASAPDMKHTADAYYDDYNLMDVRVLSTMGLVDGDIEAIKALDGVADVRPAYFVDVVSTVESVEFVFRVHSLPEEMETATQEGFINMPRLTSGRYPQKSGECLLEESMNVDLGLEIGDVMKVSSGKKEDLTGKLKGDTFTIVGTAVSSYYLTYDKDASEIGSGKVNFFMMVPAEDFDYPVYTEALVTLTGLKEMDSYSTAYQKAAERVMNQMDNLGADRSEIRLAEIKREAMGRLEEARAQLAAEEERFHTEIAAAQEKLDAARDKLVEGQATLDTEKKNYDIMMASARKQISSGEADLNAAEAEYASGLRTYNQAKEAYGKSLEDLDDTTQSLNSIDDYADEQIESINDSLASPDLTEAQRAAYLDQLANLKRIKALSGDGLSSINGLNSYAKDQMANADKQLKAARAQLDDARAQLDRAKRDLANNQAASQVKFASAQTQIDEGNVEYEAAKVEFEASQAEGAKKLSEGREQVIRAENEIEKLSAPQWYVLDRNKLYSYADYAATADRMDAIAKLFPVFFFLVAALVCLTTMTRMVDEQRSTIGAYKALGYTNGDIAIKYVLYAMLASTLGGILGILVGIRIFPKIIFDSWAMMYTLPPMQHVDQYPLMVLSVLSGVAVTTIAAYIAVNKELREAPSLLMRPKAPKDGRTIVLERLPHLWRHLSFSQKVTARNIFRYKKRFFMTVVGIAGCAALLVAGFGLSNSIGEIVNRQYREIFNYDLDMRYEPTATEEDRAETAKDLRQNPDVEQLLEVTFLNAKVKNLGDEIAVTLITPMETKSFLEFIMLQDRTTQEAIAFPETGMVIDEKLAKELGVKVGDSVTVDNGDGAVKKVQVSAINENYIFHYAYIHPRHYEEIFRLAPKYNSLMIKLGNPTRELESALGTQLIARDEVASVVYYSSAAEKFEQTVKSLNIIVLAIIVCAGLLAFVVLYNLTNINLSERIREIATIKVLGFYNGEVSAYVYRENIILSIIGAAAGLLLGINLHRVIMTSIEQDGIMFGNYIEGRSFFYAFIITLIFSVLVNLFMYRRLKNIPMVESLKSVE